MRCSPCFISDSVAAAPQQAGGGINNSSVNHVGSPVGQALPVEGSSCAYGTRVQMPNLTFFSMFMETGENEI